MTVRPHVIAWVLVVLALAWLAMLGWRAGDRLFLSAGLNGLTTAALYFLVASGFSLIFGLLKNVNLAHGSLVLLGAYLGISATDLTGSWLLGVAVGGFGAALVGLVLQAGIFRFLQGQDLRQALVTIGISVVLADAMLWVWGSDIYQFDPPDWMYGSVMLPIVRGYPLYKLALIGCALVVGVLLWLVLNRTPLGLMIRAGVDDPAMLGCNGVNVQRVFAATFAIGAALAGAGGVIGGSLMSVAPGEDTRYLLASLVVVIVGGMGSIVGTAIGALLIGLSEQYGLAYAPTYGVIFTFLIMAVVLAVRPHGIVGKGAASAPARPPEGGAILLPPRPRQARGLLVAALVLPWVASDFFTFQIVGQSLVLGLIALSLTLLAGYGGMVSLSQMTVAGMAGYLVGVVGVSNGPFTFGLGAAVAIPVAIALATVFAAFIGWLSARTEGVYTIMITLAIGVATFYLAQQNRAVFNGFQGISGVLPPSWGGIAWRSATPFYYLALVCAVASLWFVHRLLRAPFGLALQAIRDNPRRAAALGYDVVRHRIASHAVAGALAAIGGVLLAWYNTFVTPGVIGVNAMINILIIAVIGGMNRPIGAFVGALAFVLLQNFAIDLVGSDRFRMLIGAVFLAIVLFSPDGLLGLWARLSSRWPIGRPDPSIRSRSAVS